MEIMSKYLIKFTPIVSHFENLFGTCYNLVISESAIIWLCKGRNISVFICDLRQLRTASCMSPYLSLITYSVTSVRFAWIKWLHLHWGKWRFESTANIGIYLPSVVLQHYYHSVVHAVMFAEFLHFFELSIYFADLQCSCCCWFSKCNSCNPKLPLSQHLEGS